MKYLNARRYWPEALIVSVCLLILLPMWKHPHQFIHRKREASRPAPREVHHFTPTYNVEFEPEGDQYLSGDVLYEHILHYVVADAWQRYGETPLWVPHICGGYPFVAHPYNRTYSIWWIPIAFFGEVVAIKVINSLILILAMLGNFWFLRRVMALELIPAMAGIALAIASPWFTFRCCVDDNSCEVSYLFLGLYLTTVYLASVNWRNLWMPALVVNLICSEMRLGPILFPLIAIYLALFDSNFSRNGKWRTLATVAAGVSAGYLLTASKLIPLTSYLHRGINTLEFKQVEFHSIWSFFDAVFGIQGGAVGKLAGLFCIVGAIATWRRTWAYSLLAVVIVLTIIGDQSPIPISQLAQRLPVFQKFYYLGKHYNIVLVFCCLVVFSETIALVLYALKQWMVPRWGQGLVTVSVLAVALFNPLRTTVANALALEYFQPKNFSRESDFFTLSTEKINGPGTRSETCDGTHANFYTTIKDNIGVKYLYGNQLELRPQVTPKYLIDLEGKPVFNQDYWGEARFLNSNSNESPRVLSRTYQTMQVAVPASSTERKVQINHNYLTGWKTSLGSVSEQDGLLVLNLPPGDATEVRMKYAPWQHTLGVYLSLATLIALIGIAVIPSAVIKRRHNVDQDSE